MKQRSIMLITDSTAMGERLANILREHGYRVLTGAADSNGHLLVACEQPDLVLLDMRVGNEGNAWAALELLRIDPQTTQIPVVLCCTYPQLLHTKADTLQQQQITVLEKPFRAAQLLAAISQHLGAAHMRGAS